MTTMPANPTPAEGVVVPLEPTPEMVEAGYLNSDALTAEDVVGFWTAMLAARPAAPTQSAAQTGEVRALEAAFKWAYARGAGTFLQDPTGDEEWRAYAKALNLSQPEPSHD